MFTAKIMNFSCYRPVTVTGVTPILILSNDSISKIMLKLNLNLMKIVILSPMICYAH